MAPAPIADGRRRRECCGHCPPSSSATRMSERRSFRSVVRSSIDIKSWLTMGVPDVDLLRPSTCRCCGCASCPAGGGLRLHGHGIRERQVRGPLEPGFRPKVIVVVVRRYQCQGCGAVFTVVPCEVEPGRYYSAPAMVWALALFGQGVASVAVASRVCAWAAGRDGGEHSWLSLRRWCTAVRNRRLFAETRMIPAHWSNRQLAERVATSFAAACPASLVAGLSLDHQAWHGAAHGLMAP